MKTPDKIAVAFATTGRPEVLRKTLRHLEKQTRKADRIIISAITPADFEGLEPGETPVDILTTGRGLAQQRNRIVDLLTDDEVVVFLDDDFVPCDDFLENTLDIFRSDPTISLVTGTVLADGILGPGLRFEDAAAIAASAPPETRREMTPVYNGYGCNMAIRAAPLIAHRLRFDENLPLYSWLEDVDFSRVLSAYGQLVKSSDVRGVHLGVKSGRTPGVKLGYSQIVNPYYLIRKGTMAPKFGIRLAVRNVLANLVKSLRPEPYIDRFGRLRGNFRGVRDILLRRADPTNINDF